MAARRQPKVDRAAQRVDACLTKEGNMKRNIRIGSVALCILAALFGVSSAAQAQTIFLHCTGGGSNGDHTVDLANNKVDNHPASINATEID